MKSEIIKYDDSEVIIIDDVVLVNKRINIYFDCCMLPYKISNSSVNDVQGICLLYTSPSPRDRTRSRMPSSA